LCLSRLHGVGCGDFLQHWSMLSSSSFAFNLVGRCQIVSPVESAKLAVLRWSSTCPQSLGWSEVLGVMCPNSATFLFIEWADLENVLWCLFSRTLQAPSFYGVSWDHNVQCGSRRWWKAFSMSWVR
jgi:hypothetical protein